MIRQKIKDKVKDKIQRKMKDRIKDKERDSIDFGRSKVEPLFHSIFYPTLLSMVFASLFTVADGIFVGQGVGSDALAAINIVAPLFLMTTGISLMFGAGVSVVASIHLSRGNTKAAQINITQAFDVAILLMTLVAVGVYIFRIPFLRLLGCSDALLPLCQEYLLPILPGCIFIIIQIIGTFVIRLDGSPKYAASLEVIPGFLNIILELSHQEMMEKLVELLKSIIYLLYHCPICLIQTILNYIFYIEEMFSLIVLTCNSVK